MVLSVILIGTSLLANAIFLMNMPPEKKHVKGGMLLIFLPAFIWTNAYILANKTCPGKETVYFCGEYLDFNNFFVLYGTAGIIIHLVIYFIQKRKNSKITPKKLEWE